MVEQKQKYRYRFISILVALLLLLCVCSALAFDFPRWFPFNSENALQDWQEKIFQGKVLYTIESPKNDGYLLANSQATSSGLIYKIKFDVIKFPMISWEWNVKTFPSKKAVTSSSTEGWIERDDYAARVYVIFPSWNFMEIKSLEYIWDENYAAETVLTSPYFKNIKLFVLESGRNNLGQWVFEERNIYEDFKKAFGSSPPRYVGSIALMTDADNSASSAQASYKNLKVGYNNEPIDK